MKIQFTLIVTSFAHAAALEEVLGNHAVRYKTEILSSQPSARGADTAPRQKRKVIGKAELAAVSQCFANNPSWTLKQVSKDTGVSRATVGRIGSGTHVLQR